jgi:hypothetical protein
LLFKKSITISHAQEERMQTATIPISVDVNNIHNVLRVTDNFQEILGTILEILAKKLPIVIWQKIAKVKGKWPGPKLLISMPATATF